MDWAETRLCLQLWLHRFWPFLALSWWFERGVPFGDSLLDAPPRYALFQHAPLLEQLQTPWPNVKLVLSTQCRYVYSREFAADRLPPGLRSRVVGSTFSTTDFIPVELEDALDVRTLVDVVVRGAWSA